MRVRAHRFLSCQIAVTKPKIKSNHDRKKKKKKSRPHIKIWLKTNEVILEYNHFSKTCKISNMKKADTIWLCSLAHFFPTFTFGPP